MSEALTLEQVSFSKSGATLTLQLTSGQSLVVVGPAASGKSRMLRVIAGIEAAPFGKVTRPEAVSVASVDLPRRAKPQGLVRDFGGPSPDLAAEVLSALKLWDVRGKPISDLTPSQVLACELIAPLSSHAELLVIDGQLDALDPWALRTTLDLLVARQAAGAIVVVSTQRPDLVAKFDAIVALHKGNMRFAGTSSDLLRSGPPQHLEVYTDNKLGVRALVAPFEVSIRETDDGVVMQASEGQQLAARLLLEGYGDVKLVVLKTPTLEEALLSLFS